MRGGCPSAGVGQSAAYAAGLAAPAAAAASALVSPGSAQLGPGAARKHHLALAGLLPEEPFPTQAARTDGRTVPATLGVAEVPQRRWG